MLTEEQIQLISTYTVGCVATVRADGAPAVSPKATFLVIDDRTLAFSNIRSEGTVENLRRDPRVEVDFVDVFKRLGCRVRGRASYERIEEVALALRSSFEKRWPDLYGLIKGVVTIHVSEAQLLTSPSYDVGANQDELAAHWLQHYSSALNAEPLTCT